jgi:hypothetical protein
MDKLYIEIDKKLSNSNLVELQEWMIRAHIQRLQKLHNFENSLAQSLTFLSHTLGFYTLNPQMLTN